MLYSKIHMRKKKRKHNKKKYVKIRKKFLDDYSIHLNKCKNNLPSKLKKYTDIKTNSWFTMKKYNVNDVNCNLKFKKTKSKKQLRCKQIEMKLNKNQQKIILNWMKAYTAMYNSALDYVRENHSLTKNIIIRRTLVDYKKTLKDNNRKTTEYSNFFHIRNKLKNKKKKIQQKYNDKKSQLYIHSLDYAIKQLCANIKSAETNLMKGHIKRFRLKFWKNSRPSKTIEIEKQEIKNNKLAFRKLGDINYLYNGESVELIGKNIKNNVKINYNEITKKFILLIPIKCIKKKQQNKKKILSLDPGIRTFMKIGRAHV